MKLRNYQQEAIDAVDNHIRTKDTNPCVVIPTAGGKSVCMAALIAKWQEECPTVRGCILAHRKELVAQNADKFSRYYKERFGIFSNGLRRKDCNFNITFASIDSIYKKSGEFKPFDFIFVDEAHRIPPSGEGKYRTFITGCKRFNQDLRIIGWTATPYRMNCGNICHKDHILNEICYEAKISDLLQQGFLCNLRSKVSTQNLDLTEVRRFSGGDYIIKSLAKETNKDKIIYKAISEAVKYIKQEERKSIIFYCVDVEHCVKVSAELRKYGIAAPFVTAKTSQYDRDNIANAFRQRRLSALCNVNVYTEGFDVPHVDCIVLLRPTLSPGLFYQMVGRGMRLDKTKSFCLVLDFANCIDEHGPIDCLNDNKGTVTAVCKQCRESFSRAIRQCPVCGWEVPKQELERLEQKERERRLHGDKISKRNILSCEPETLKVDSVYVSRHCKEGSQDSVCIQYRCGLRMFREWICLDHDGQAGLISQDWWRRRFRSNGTITVNQALESLLTSQTILEFTKTITVIKDKKYWKVIGYNQ